MKKLFYVSFILAAVLTANMAAAEGITFTDEEMKQAKKIYFDRCAGCHGTLRKGATGPNLEPVKTTALGTEGLQTFIAYGTPGGMPSFKETLSEQEIGLMAKFLQVTPPQPSEMSLADMKESWKVLVPVKDRPKKPMHKRN